MMVEISRRDISRYLFIFCTFGADISEAGPAPETQASPYTRPQGLSPRAVSFTLVCPAAKRSQDAEIYIDQLCQLDPGIARAYAPSQAFLALVRERRGADLEAWMAEAMHSGIDDAYPFRAWTAGGSGRDHRRAHSRMEQWRDRRPDSSPEVAQAAGLWPGRLCAPTTARPASGITRTPVLRLSG